MKKGLVCLLLVIMVISLFGTLVAAQVPSPRPPGWGLRPTTPPPTRVTTPFPGIWELPAWFKCKYVPSKLVLTLEETEALSNMTRGQCYRVHFVLPMFLIEEELTWTSSDETVVKLKVATEYFDPDNLNRCYGGLGVAQKAVTTKGLCNRGPIHDVCVCPVGSGTTLITLTNADGTVHFEFYVTVK